MEQKIKRSAKGMVFAALAFCLSQTGYAYQQVNVDRLFEAAQNVVAASHLCEEGSHYQAKTRLRIASYRVRIVLADIRYTPGLEKAVHALEVTNEKLRDPGLTPDEKVAFGLDCLSVALPVLIKRASYQIGVTQAVRYDFRLAKLLVSTQVFGPVVKVLNQALSMLNVQIGCPMTSAAYRKAAEAVRVALDKVSDPGLTSDEKEFFVLDCLSVAERHLRNVF